VGGNLERQETLVARYQLAVVVLVIIAALAVRVRTLAPGDMKKAPESMRTRRLFREG
jgi:hypothetical protein